MKRRDFIRSTALLTGGVLVAPSVLAGRSSIKRNKKITILHTNDTHSNIDPFPLNHAKYPGLGGVSRRYELVSQVRDEVENVLLLDAGDIFQGTPYFNRYNGVLEMKVMSRLGYDAATMGNHDFDIGVNGFVNAQESANFPFICSNYDFTNTELYGRTKGYYIIEKGGIKVGVFGLGVQLKGLVPDDKYGETKYLDPIEMAQEYTRILKSSGCDLIICLSHLGYEYASDKISDLKLAESTSDIHLIIGGHTHTFLEKPTEVINKTGNSVLVNQVGWAGVNLGRIDFEIEQKLKKKGSFVLQ